jgi:hypothetical protein
MNLSEISRRVLSAMAEIVRELDEQNRLSHLAPIDVARGIIAIYDRLHPCIHRTMRLSSNAVCVRGVFKQANDPNKPTLSRCRTRKDHIPSPEHLVDSTPCSREGCQWKQ